MGILKPDIPELCRKNGLYLLPTVQKGQGLFCREDIASGDIIEYAPVFVYNEDEGAHLSQTGFGNYAFQVKDVSREFCAWRGIKDQKKASGIVMGAASYCNHFPVPNADVSFTEKNNMVYATLKALCDIPKDTEIGVSYGKSWFAGRAFFGRGV